MLSQCMVLQQIIQAVLVVCYVLITVLQIIGPYWVLEDTSLQTMAQWIGNFKYCSTVVKGKSRVYPRMQAWPVSIPIPFESGYDIYEHSKASDISKPTE